MKHYDYIFIGSGLAALMTLHQMVLSGKFAENSILVIDPDTKKQNDRTWCFWEKGNGDWDSIVYRKWEQALFASANYRRTLDFTPYAYKMIRGLDFYTYVLDSLSKVPGITFLNESVEDYSEFDDWVIVQTTNQVYSCSKAFCSIYKQAPVLRQKKYPLLQQHFMGWVIQSDVAIFDPEKPVFMDFSIPQSGNTRFMYVLPFSKTEALIEYTLFSEKLLPHKNYEEALREYIAQLGIEDYRILDREQASIPMTSYPFWKRNTKNILHIGTAGGWTKASTGYTFKNADKKSKALVSFLQTNNDFREFYQRDKFWIYDLLLLDILDRTNEKGALIFSTLFQKGNPALILKFLDEDTSLWEDLQVISKCPKSLFLAALFRRLFTRRA